MSKLKPFIHYSSTEPASASSNCTHRCVNYSWTCARTSVIPLPHWPTARYIFFLSRYLVQRGCMSLSRSLFLSILFLFLILLPDSVWGDHCSAQLRLLCVENVRGCFSVLFSPVICMRVPAEWRDRHSCSAKEKKCSRNSCHIKMKVWHFMRSFTFHTHW